MYRKSFHINSLLRATAVFTVAFVSLSTMSAAQDAAGQAEGPISAIGTPVPDMPPADTILPPPGTVTAMPDEQQPVAADEVPPSPEIAVSPDAAASMPEITNAPPEPSNAELEQPAGNTMSKLPDAAQGDVAGTNVMGDSGVQQTHSGTYYDADALVPDRDLAKAGAIGPRKIDPALEPGQRFIVVEKSASASSYEAQYTAATRALKLGRYAAAMEMFENLYKKNHKDPRILMGLAVAQQGAGFKESAARTYEELLSVQPNNADAIINLMGLMREQYPSVTLRKLSDLRAKYPTNPGIPAQMGLVSAELKNYPDAIRYLEIAASMDPNNSSHVYNMAIVADRSNRPSDAIKLYERALQLDASYGDSANALPREQIYDRLVVLRRKV